MMKQMNWAFISVLLLAGSRGALAQADNPAHTVLEAQAGMVTSQEGNHQNAAALDPQREKRALQVFLKSV